MEMTKKISGWCKYPSANTIIALKANKMLQYGVFEWTFNVLLSKACTTSGLRLNKIGMI